MKSPRHFNKYERGTIGQLAKSANRSRWKTKSPQKTQSAANVPPLTHPTTATTKVATAKVVQSLAKGYNVMPKKPQYRSYYKFMREQREQKQSRSFKYSNRRSQHNKEKIDIDDYKHRSSRCDRYTNGQQRNQDRHNNHGQYPKQMNNQNREQYRQYQYQNNRHPPRANSFNDRKYEIHNRVKNVYHQAAAQNYKPKPKPKGNRDRGDDWNGNGSTIRPPPSNRQNHYHQQDYRVHHYRPKDSNNPSLSWTPKTDKNPNPKFKHTPRPELPSFVESDLPSLKQIDYWIREKTDAPNVLCLVTAHSVYLIDKNFNLRMLTDVFYGSHGFVGKPNAMSLFDDCIAFDGQSVANRDFSIRQKKVSQFLEVYNRRLLKYAARRRKLKQPKEEDEKDEELYHHHFGSKKSDDPKKRLIDISMQMDNGYKQTKMMKNDILQLFRDDCQKLRSFKNRPNDPNASNYDNILDKIELDVVSVLFVGKEQSKATAETLSKLSKCVKYEDNLDDDGLYFTDPQTGIKTKHDGIIFVPEHNNFMMDRNGSAVHRLWQQKELLSLNLMVKKSRSNNKNAPPNRRHHHHQAMNSDRDMDEFIDFDMLHLYVIDDEPASGYEPKTIWFNRIDMGQNEKQQQVPWNPWHLKQRSTFSHLVSMMDNAKRNEPYDAFIVACNYDFDKCSWSLFKLREELKLPSTVQMAQELIKQIEECVNVETLIRMLSEKEDKRE